MVVQHLREHGVDYDVEDTNFGALRVTIGQVTVGWVVETADGWTARYGSGFETAIVVGRSRELSTAVQLLDG